MSDGSQFFKVILLLVTAILLFMGMKTVLPDRLFPERESDTENVLIDSVLLELLEEEKQLADVVHRDTLGSAILSDTSSQAMEEHTSLITKLEEALQTDSLLDPSITVDGYRFLQKFYSKLASLENKSVNKVRIAYFGDSMNDGDLIVQDIRILLQDSFGGYGVGYVPVTSLSAASRGSVRHQYSNNWRTQSFVSVKQPSTPFGLDGQVALVKDSTMCWVSYDAGYMKNSTSLYSPTLFYGHSENKDGFIKVKIEGEEEEKEWQLNPDNLLNIGKLSDNQIKSLRINFNQIENIPIYGIDFSSKTGIHVDNFSLRGNSGLALSGFDPALINMFDKILGYDLIVLQYGTNVLNYGSLDYHFYERGMSSVISKLRRCFPHADILVVSTADKASKVDTEMVTDPAVVALVKAQKSFSSKGGAAFINLYSLMGGENSMTEWVEEELANKDYTHFNANGSKKIGKMLYQKLIDGYEIYKREIENKE